jgi:hypothetical protein
VIREETFAGMGGREEDAPKTAVGPASIELVKSTLNSHSLHARQWPAFEPPFALIHAQS